MAWIGQERGKAEVRFSGRWKQLIDGDIGVEDLDTEELAKGKLRDKDGKFRGRPPKFIPRQLVDAMRSEHHRRINAALEESLSDTVKTMRAIMNDPEQDGATRLRAAIYVYERFMGKTPDRVVAQKGDKVDDVIERIMYDIGESPIEREIAETEAELTRPPAARRRGRVAQSRVNGRKPNGR